VSTSERDSPQPLDRPPLPPPYVSPLLREESTPSPGPIGFYYGAVELPPISATGDGAPPDDRGDSRGSVLHATVEPGGAALCGEVTGRLVPTFARWRAGHLGCLTLCPTCSALAPPKRRRLLALPSRRGPRPGAECHYQQSAWLVANAWFWFLGWMTIPCPALVYVNVWQANASVALAAAAGLAAVVFVTAPSLWVLWRRMRFGWAIGVEGVTRYGLAHPILSLARDPVLLPTDPIQTY